MSTITVYKRGEKHKTVPLEAATIGRRPENTLQLEDDVISRNHAEVLVQDDGYYVQDVGSSNGTYCNGRKLEGKSPEKLKDGDRVRLGREGAFELQFTIDTKPKASEAMLHTSVERSVHQPRPEPLMAHLLKENIPVWDENWDKGPIEVKVADIVEETRDTKTYRFVGKDGPVMFSYKPGQFVTMIVKINGKEERRSYSMSSTPSRPHCIELTIKLVSGGLVSNWLAENLKLGDVLKFRGPSGKFTCFEYPSDKLLFVGAGSGITPLMSMSRWILDTAADADVKFLVSARTPADIIYRRELEFLSARHDNFQCAVTITGGASGTDAWLGQMGRITPQGLQLFSQDIDDRHVFTCGPEPFMTALEDCLKTIEFPMKQFHKESFGPVRVAKGTNVKPRDAISRSNLDIPQAAGGKGLDPALSEPKFQVSFNASDKKVATSGEASLLELAEANGIEIDYACRNGACGVCKVKCTPGAKAVEMPDEVNLEDDEAAEGMILACVARPVADLTLEA